jgi:glycosyltransferase involved in cell wall biosynthesis
MITGVRWPPDSAVRVLLLSAYAAHSHVHWQRALLTMFPDWEWQVMSLPPRHFSWRVRGNPLYWSLEQRAQLERPYDLLIATSMVDLATLRGLVPPLCSVPALLYFHENQFAYPQRPGQASLLEAQMVSLYSALAADVLAFNSAYNRDTFLAGLDVLLRRLPDHVPPGIATALAGKARVLPVPVDPGEAAPPGGDWPGSGGDYPGRPLRLVWTGRFEYDKGGDTLWHALAGLERTGLPYELALCGQRFRSSPPIFARIEEELSRRLVHMGYLPSVRDYRALLRGADVVLSTAQHEFQGLAVLEAVASGCLPAVPDRLAYPEIYPVEFRYLSSPEDPAQEGAAAAALICRLAGLIEEGTRACPDVAPFGLARMEPAYREVLQALAGRTATAG